jgi:hypothetical protein
MLTANYGQEIVTYIDSRFFVSTIWVHLPRIIQAKILIGGNEVSKITFIIIIIIIIIIIK